MSFAYMPLYTGDYLRDTRHLSPQKHGVYLLLLMHCWDQKGPLPLDEQEIAGIANCRSSDEIDALRYVLSRYFVRMEDGYYNNRINEEVCRAIALSSKNRANGLKSAAVRRSRSRSSTQAVVSEGNDTKEASSVPPTERPFNDRSTTAERSSVGHTITTTTSPPYGVEVVVGKNSLPSAGRENPSEAPDFPAQLGEKYEESRIPSCPIEEIIGAYHRRMPACPRVLVRNKTRDGYIRQRWRDVFAQGKATDARDALALFDEFFAYAAKSKFLTGRSQAGKDRKPFVADLEWLMRPSNFAKVVEGRYHDAAEATA